MLETIAVVAILAIPVWLGMRGLLRKNGYRRANGKPDCGCGHCQDKRDNR